MAEKRNYTLCKDSSYLFVSKYSDASLFLTKCVALLGKYPVSMLFAAKLGEPFFFSISLFSPSLLFFSFFLVFPSNSLIFSSPFPLPSFPFFFLLFSHSFCFSSLFSSSTFPFLSFLTFLFPPFFSSPTPAFLFLFSSLYFIFLISSSFSPPLSFLFFLLDFFLFTLPGGGRKSIYSM